MMYYHTQRRPVARMAKTKVAITLDTATLRHLDRLVRAARYPAEEKSLAEEGLSADGAAWPEY